MYNLNVQLASSANLTVENSCTTPKTPEILNSLIAMSNPFDNYQNGATTGHMAEGGGNMASPRTASSPPDTSAASPTFIVPATPPSVQHTCSQLIKEGLKVTIQRKRQISGRDSIIVEPKSCRRDEVGSRVSGVLFYIDVRPSLFFVQCKEMCGITRASQKVRFTNHYLIFHILSLLR